MEYFVYALLDTSKDFNKYINDIFLEHEPFYIGKGKDDRPYKHFNENTNNTTNRYKFNVIQKIKTETGEYPTILILKNNLSEEDSFLYEIEMIEFFGMRPLGLLTNRTEGGSGGDTYKYLNDEQRKSAIDKIKKYHTGRKRTDKQKAKRRENQPDFKGEKNPMYGKERTDEWKKSHSEFMTGLFSGEKNPMYNKTHTDEAKKNIGDKNRGNVAWNKGKTGVYSEETLNKLRKERKRGNGTIPVYQFDLNMNIIHIWNSLAVASKTLDINKSGIINCCRGRYSTSGGFIWKYEKDANEILNK